jgi:hypothetical protein
VTKDRKRPLRKRRLDTGVRTPGMNHAPIERTHRDAAEEVKRRAERERLERDSRINPVEKAARLLALDRESRSDGDGEES